MSLLPLVHGLLTIANPHARHWLVTDQPSKDGGLPGPLESSVAHRLHDGAKVGSKAERRAEAGLGRPCMPEPQAYV